MKKAGEFIRRPACFWVLALRFLNPVFHPVAFALDRDGFGVVQDTIEHSGGEGGVVVEDLGPFLIVL